MYHIYQTNGWILGSIEAGESNRFLEIFTLELGLVRGMAQGVRKLSSKLRYGLQDYSYGKISLVKGRHVWRVVNVQRLDDFNWIYENKKVFQLVCRIFSLLRRLIKGEAKDAEIFDEVNNAITFAGLRDLTEEGLSKLEIILVFRILQKLGYVGRDERFDHLADFAKWNDGLLDIDDIARSAILRQINNSLAHSHL